MRIKKINQAQNRNMMTKISIPLLSINKNFGFKLKKRKKKKKDLVK